MSVMMEDQREENGKMRVKQRLYYISCSLSLQIMYTYDLIDTNHMKTYSGLTFVQTCSKF